MSSDFGCSQLCDSLIVIKVKPRTGTDVLPGSPPSSLGSS